MSAGMECLYSAESIRLALACGETLPAGSRWRSLDPAIHIGYARRLQRADVAVRILEKYIVTGDGAHPGTLHALAAYCGMPDPGEDGDRVQAAVTEIFRWTSIDADPRGTGPLRLWFTAESVVLAGYGGYANPARNMTEGPGHRDWSGEMPIRSIIRDLADKTREQFLRLCGTGERQAVDFSAETFARLAAWGGPVPAGCPSSGAPADWHAPCQEWFRADPGQLWHRLDLMLRGAASHLVIAGRAEPVSFPAQTVKFGQ